MNIVVDGIIFQLQKHGGISRIFREILPRMCEMDETLNITLLMSGKSKQVLLQHPRIHIRFAPWYLMLRTRKEQWLRASVGNTEDKIWHSTQYTRKGGHKYASWSG